MFLFYIGREEFEKFFLVVKIFIVFFFFGNQSFVFLVRFLEFVNNYYFQKKWEFFGGQRIICRVYVELFRKLNSIDVFFEAKF